MKKRDILAWTLPGLTVLIVDLVTKALLSDESAVLIPGVIALNPKENTGMALGLMEGMGPVIAGASVLLVLLCLWLMRGTRVSGLGRCALSMMAGGAVGNLYDRVILGAVRDLFELLFMDFYIFNVADVGVVAGTVLCGVSLLFRPKDWRKA